MSHLEGPGKHPWDCQGLPECDHCAARVIEDHNPYSCAFCEADAEEDERLEYVSDERPSWGGEEDDE